MELSQTDVNPETNSGNTLEFPSKKRNSDNGIWKGRTGFIFIVIGFVLTMIALVHLMNENGTSKQETIELKQEITDLKQEKIELKDENRKLEKRTSNLEQVINKMKVEMESKLVLLDSKSDELNDNIRNISNAVSIAKEETMAQLKSVNNRMNEEIIMIELDTTENQQIQGESSRILPISKILVKDKHSDVFEEKPISYLDSVKGTYEITLSNFGSENGSILVQLNDKSLPHSNLQLSGQIEVKLTCLMKEKVCTGASKMGHYSGCEYSCEYVNFVTSVDIQDQTCELKCSIDDRCTIVLKKKM